MEAHTFFRMLGDVSGKRVLDLACGEGFYTRQFKMRGASTVIGVDISTEMIRLARESEQSQPLGITYHVQDVLSLDLGGSAGSNAKFDLVCAAYLFNYAKTPQEIEQMGRVIAQHLEAGGRFVTINSNPDYDGAVEDMFSYGFTRENKGDREGDEIIYRFYQPDNQQLPPIDVVNYHHSKDTYEKALQKAGLSDIHWHTLEVSSNGVATFGSEYWAPILTHQPVTGLSCCRL